MARQPRHPCPQDIAVRNASKASGNVSKGLFAQRRLKPPVNLCQRIKV